MRDVLPLLIERLEHDELELAEVIHWSSPVPSFGDVKSANVATLGLNPSNREFVDVDGQELEGEYRRFHTLTSLGLKSWSEVDESQLKLILDTCRNYFRHNPYDTWFKSLDNLISGTNASYYCSMFSACHLDLVPYATKVKWTELSGRQKKALLQHVGDLLGLLLRGSEINVLVLNGQTVVDTLCGFSNLEYTTTEFEDWKLPRKKGSGVKGLGYSGTLSNIGGVELDREIRVLGYNHNIQSSFGVTNKVRSSIGNWIGLEALEYVY